MQRSEIKSLDVIDEDPQTLTVMSRSPSKIKVCHIASGDLWAGAEAQIATLLDELRGFSDLSLSAILFNRGKLAEKISALGMPTFILDESHLNTPQLLNALLGCFRSVVPHVIHTHRYKENILGGLGAKLCGIPAVIQTIHGVQEGLRGWKWAKMCTYGYMNDWVTRMTAKGIIGVSREITNLAASRLPGAYVVCVPNGINVNAAKPWISSWMVRKELRIPEDAVVIGTVCRLTAIKGIEYLLKAAQDICHENDGRSIRIVVVGDGPLRGELEALARRLDLSEYCIFLGSRDDVYDLMNMMDIYVIPSLHEGIPMALLEAMALGCSVVASSVGGIPEVLRDGVEGRLVCPGDVVGLRDVIKELVDSGEARKRFGEAGRRRVMQCYDSKVMASRVREVYLHAVRGAEDSDGDL